MNTHHNPSRIANRLRVYRSGRALTQEDLAAQAGIGVATLQRAERGARVSADTIASLAAALDVDARDLAGDDACKTLPYVILEPVTTARQLLALLASADRLDFEFTEIEDLDTAALVEKFHAFLTPIGAERVANGPVAQVKQELDARELLQRFGRENLVVTCGTYTLHCHEVDDDFGTGTPILLATWTDRVAAIRISAGGIPISRAFPADDLDRWESPGDGFVFPVVPGDADVETVA